MKVSRIVRAALLAALLSAAGTVVLAQEAPVENPDQLSMLKDKDPKLARNKKFVFDFWRIVYEGRHLDEAPKYMDAGYIQHNPNVPSGRDALVKFMRESRPVRPIEPKMTFPLIALVAEGDMVVVATVSYAKDPQKPSERYASTHFDMYRIEGGKIAEHWDNLPKDPALLHSDPNATNKP